MKIRPVIIYIAVFLVFIIALVIFSTITKESNNTGSVTSGQMPEDDVHKGMSSKGTEQMPSKANVMGEAMEKLNQLKTDYEKNPNDTLKTREYADMLTLAHDREKALELYGKILTKDPKRIDIMLQQTFIYFEDKKFDKALEATNRALSVDKNHVISKYNLGAIYNAMGDKLKATNIWKELVQQYPKSEIAHIAEQSLKQLEKN